MCAASVPQSRLVRERHRLLEVLDGVGAADLRLPQQGAERLVTERGVVGIRRDARDDRPGELVGTGVADPHHAGAAVEEAVVARGGARVPGAAGRHERREPLDGREELVAQRPPARGHEHLGGDAVVGRVVREHASDALRLHRERPRIPGTRNEEHGGDVAELARDLLAQERVLPRHPRGALRTRRAPDDEIVRAVRAGDVHLVHAGVMREVPALVRAPVDDGQDTRARSPPRTPPRGSARDTRSPDSS